MIPIFLCPLASFTKNIWGVYTRGTFLHVRACSELWLYLQKTAEEGRKLRLYKSIITRVSQTKKKKKPKHFNQLLLHDTNPQLHIWLWFYIEFLSISSIPVYREALLIANLGNRMNVLQLQQILHSGSYPKFDWARPEQPDFAGPALYRIGQACPI